MITLLPKGSGDGVVGRSPRGTGAGQCGGLRYTVGPRDCLRQRSKSPQRIGMQLIGVLGCSGSGMISRHATAVMMDGRRKNEARRRRQTLDFGGLVTLSPIGQCLRLRRLRIDLAFNALEYFVYLADTCQTVLPGLFACIIGMCLSPGYRALLVTLSRPSDLAVGSCRSTCLRLSTADSGIAPLGISGLRNQLQFVYSINLMLLCLLPLHTPFSQNCS